jgi:YYY domain-containing protein
MMAAGTWGAALALLVPLRKVSNKGIRADSGSGLNRLDEQDEPVVPTGLVVPTGHDITTLGVPEGEERLKSLLQADEPVAPDGHVVTTLGVSSGPERLKSLLQADEPVATTQGGNDEPVVPDGHDITTLGVPEGEELLASLLQADEPDITTLGVPEGEELLASLLQADEPIAPDGHDITTEGVPLQAEDEEKGLILLKEPIEPDQESAEKVASYPIGTASYEARPPLSPFALFFASLAAIFVSVLGNLGELKVVTEGLISLSQSSFRSGIPGLETLVRSLDGLVRGIIINGQPLAGRAEWPYWNATRTIEGTINEFPWFTFLYADLHAHMMALPFTLLAIGVALSFMRAPLKEGWLTEGLRLGIMALVLGALWPINTWDFPTYALIAFAGLGLREWRRDGSITIAGIWAVLWRWGLILLLSRLLFKPFHDNLASAYSSVGLWEGSRTELSEFLIVHGFFLFSIFFALINDFAYGHGQNAIVRLLRFKLRYFGRGKRASHLYKRLVGANALNPSALYAPIITLLALFLLAALIGYAVPALTLCLLLASMLLFFRSHPQPEWQMVLFFIMLGLGLTLSVEIVVLKGDIGRMNTVFKFYLQVWVLWGIAAALGAAQVVSQQERWLPEWRFVWRTGMALLCGIALLYPIFATYAKINDRLDASVGPSLNGAAFLEQAILHEVDRNTQSSLPIPFKWDADAIRWIQENISGSPTIAEINTAPEKLYGWGNRYAVWTGNPAIIGWDHHQRQQRAATLSTEVDQRVREVKENIFNTPDAQLAHKTLQSYGADYIIIGPLERAYSRPEGIAKFEPNRGIYWDLVYDENQEVKIYKVLE